MLETHSNYDDTGPNNIDGNHLGVLEHIQFSKSGPLDGLFHSHERNCLSPVLDVPFLPNFYHTRRHSSSNSGSHDVELNHLDFDCKAPENPLAYLDDAINGELVAFDAIDDEIGKDSFAIFSCSHDIDILSDGSRSVFRIDQLNMSVDARVSSTTIDQLNMSVDARVSSTTTETFEHQKLLLASVPDDLSIAEDFLVARMDSGPSINAAEAVSQYTEDPIERDISTERPNHRQQRTRQCDRCDVLRCIVHTNGLQDTRLEIHGCEGQNYHAVLQTRFCFHDGCPPTLEQQMVEFPVGNSEYVKQFLLQYSLLRRKEGFVLQQDSLLLRPCSAERVMTRAGLCRFKETDCCSTYPAFPGPDSSCKGFEGTSCLANRTHEIDTLDGAGNAATSTTPVKPIRTNAAAQRERTGKLKMSDLAKHFHLPINAAAKELGICPTVLKKICRRNGMRRWPHRKIKSIERIIATLEQTIADGDGQGDEGIRMEIAMLRNERTQLCAGLMGQA